MRAPLIAGLAALLLASGCASEAETSPSTAQFVPGRASLGGAGLPNRSPRAAAGVVAPGRVLGVSFAPDRQWAVVLVQGRARPLRVITARDVDGWVAWAYDRESDGADPTLGVRATWTRTHTSAGVEVMTGRAAAGAVEAVVRADGALLRLPVERRAFWHVRWGVPSPQAVELVTFRRAD